MRRLLLTVVGMAFALLILTPGQSVSAQDEGQTQKVVCDPFVNAAASALITGWGQWLNGEQDKAVLHLTVGIGLTVGAVLLYPTTLSLLLAAARTVWGLYSVYDAFTTCTLMHKEAQQTGINSTLLIYRFSAG